ncbi:MAG: insulinase family protein, partial [Campylobacterales bacterium]|nr:insulinase family protein [Campylobacterales bacterium]
LDAKAISLHANAGNEALNIELVSLKEHFDYGIGMLKTLLKEPNYSDEAYNKIIKQSLARIEKYRSDYDYISWHKLKSIIFKDTHMAHPRIGTVKSLEEIKLQDIQSNLAKVIGYNNVIVVVGGDIGFEEASRYIHTILSPLQEVESVEAQSLELSSDKAVHEVNEPNTQQVYIYFASPFTIKYNDKDQYKARVAAHILGAGGFGSRMMEEIRVKRGLAYSAWASFVNYRFSNYFYGALQTKIKSQDEAIDVVKAMVDEFVAKGVSQDELDKAKKYLLGSEPLKNESLSQRINKAFGNYYLERPLDYNTQELELIEKLSLQELNSFIKSHPEIKDLTFSVVTAKEENKK